LIWVETWSASLRDKGVEGIEREREKEEIKGE
jgi:hypothetical protein